MPPRDLVVLDDVSAVRRARCARTRDTRASASPPFVRKSSTQRHSSSRQLGVGARRSHLGAATPPPRTRRPARRSRRAARARRAAGRPAGATRSRPAPRRRAPPRPRCSSSAFVGTHVTRLTAPGRCPLRPARCSNRATPFGLPICSTRSTGEKSTPRSSDDVATTQRSRPVAQPILDPFAPIAVERAVMQRDDARPIGPRRENRLIPDLRLRPRVREDDGARRLRRSPRRPAAASACRGGRPRESARRPAG